MIAIRETHRQFQLWLTDSAVPFQAQVARDGFGFHERITPEGEPVTLPQRARVAARQLYVFSRLMELGIDGARPLAEHARDMLVTRHLMPDGAVIPLAGGDGGFDLYDVAFCLFALGSAAPSVLSREAAAVRADRVLTRLYQGWRHPLGGFEEAQPRALPLRANPHMHLLEACLAWEAGPEPCDPRFTALADEIAALCLSRFRDPVTGAVREAFDGDWGIVPARDNVVEPGHQFEWGWLLLRWGTQRDDDDAKAAGAHLIDLAETRGINRAGLAMNALTPGLSPRDTTARLWPQTERIKAWSLRARLSAGAERRRALDAVLAAGRGLLRYMDHPLRGSWWETLSDDGKPLLEPARTSSLYHIVGAHDELEHLLARKPVKKTTGIVCQFVND